MSMNSTIKHLDMVRLLLRQQRKDIDTIRRSRYKRQGVYSIALTNDEKNEQIQSVQNQYKRRIGEIYTRMNAELEADGREPLTNPFI